MDKNSLIGLGLIFLLLIGYYFINQPNEKELALQKRYADSIQLVKQNDANSFLSNEKRANFVKDSLRNIFKNDTNALKAQYGALANQVIGEEKLFYIENKNLKITLTNKGGRIKQVQLKQFKTDSRKPVYLLGQFNSDNYISFNSKSSVIKSSDFYWTLLSSDSKTIAFKMLGENNSEIVSSFSLSDSGYNVQSQIKVVGLQNNLAPGSKFILNWQNDVPLQERDIEKEKILTTLYFKTNDDKVDYIGETKNKTITLEKDARWVSFKQQFFNTTIISESGINQGSKLTTADAMNAGSIKNMLAEIELPYKNEQEKVFDLKFYFGPNKYYTLKAQDESMDKIIPLGWGIFGWMNRYMIIPIFNFLQQYISNYGLVILCLTLIIKTLLLPLVFKSFKSTAKMKLLKPELDEIKEKHKDDMQGAQVENLKLYKKAGVNPLGGCLPMLLQMPVLVAVFQFVPSAFEFRQQAFLWADDLSIYDSIWNFGKLPIIDYIYGDHVSLFTLLMTISTLVYTRLNNQMTGVNEQMKYISYLMPILFLGFFNKYAAALTYYYFLSNIITFTQQWAIKFFIDEDKLNAQIAESKSKKGESKQSAFQKKLEEMSKNKKKK